MKIGREELRELIKESLKDWARRSSRSHKQSGSRISGFGNLCDLYLKMLITTTDAPAAEEYMNVFYEPDQDQEHECMIALDDEIAAVESAIKKDAPGAKIKTQKVKRELKKAKISDTKPRKVTDKSGTDIVNFKDWVKNIGQKT